MGSGIVGDAGFFVPARMRRAGRSLPGGGNGGGNGDGNGDGNGGGNGGGNGDGIGNGGGNGGGNGNGNGEVPGEAPGLFVGLLFAGVGPGPAAAKQPVAAAASKLFEMSSSASRLFRRKNFRNGLKLGQNALPAGFRKRASLKNCTIVRISARSAKISRNEQCRFKRGMVLANIT